MISCCNAKRVHANPCIGSASKRELTWSVIKQSGFSYQTTRCSPLSFIIRDEKVRFYCHIRTYFSWKSLYEIDFHKYTYVGQIYYAYFLKSSHFCKPIFIMKYEKLNLSAIQSSSFLRNS